MEEGQEGVSRQRVTRMKHLVQCNYVKWSSQLQEGGSKGVIVDEGWWISG